MKKIETQPQIRNLALQRAYCVYTFSHYWIIREIEAEPPLLPTISPYPTMRHEAIRSIIPISCRRYPKSV